MERLIEVLRIQEQEMRAERQVEAAPRERQHRQRGVNVATVVPAKVVVPDKGPHCRRSNGSELVEVPDPLPPDEVAGISPRLVHHQVVDRGNALLNLVLPETVERIA